MFKTYLEPALGDVITGGLFYPNTAHSINPYRLVTSLAEYFSKNGGKFIQQEVLAIDPRDVSQGCLQTNNSDILAKDIVIACGAWSKNLVNSIGHKVPLETERGYHLMLPAPKVEIPRPITPFGINRF